MLNDSVCADAVPQNCRWEREAEPQPFALSTTVDQLQARYNALESFIVSTFGASHPELAQKLQLGQSDATSLDIATTIANGAPPRTSPVQAIPDDATSSLRRRGWSRISRSGVDMETEDAANVVRCLFIL